MGWRPREVRESTIPELLAAWDGYIGFHGAKPAGGEVMSRAELEDLMRQYPD